MMKNSIKYTIFTCALGYFFIVASVVVLSIIIRIITGYYPSFTFFTLALITFRLVEIHQGFLIAPLLIAIFTMMLLSKTSINIRIVAGVSLTSYYFLLALIYLIIGAGEFPFEVLIPWLPWVFILGFTSSIIVDKLSFHARGKASSH